MDGWMDGWMMEPENVLKRKEEVIKYKYLLQKKKRHLEQKNEIPAAKRGQERATFRVLRVSKRTSVWATRW
jgi:hypothetical protein